MSEYFTNRDVIWLLVAAIAFMVGSRKAVADAAVSAVLRKQVTGLLNRIQAPTAAALAEFDRVTADRPVAQPKPPPPWSQHPDFGSLSTESFSFDPARETVSIVDDYTQTSTTVPAREFAEEANVTVDDIRRYFCE